MSIKPYERNDNIKISLVVARYYLPHIKLEKLILKFIKKFVNKNFIDVKNIKFIDLKSETADLKNLLSFEWMDKEPNFFDFSAYQEIQIDDNQDLFLYINDTIFIKHPWKLIGQKLKSLIPTLSVIENPSAIGIVYPYTEALTIDKVNPTMEHITTFCFLLNKSANEIFNKKLNSLPKTDSEVSDWIYDKINSNLFIDYIMNIHIFGPSSHWRWKRITSNFSKKTLYSKAISVILEYELNASILNSNGIIIPISRDYKYLIFQKIQSMIGKLMYREYF